jgi:hypothetical protein
MRTTASLVGLVVLLAACGCASRSGHLATLEPTELVEPVDVTSTEVYLDGGTVGVLLTDAHGTQLAFSLAGMRWEGDPHVGRGLYLGKMHFKGAEVGPLPRGGETECAILRLLRAYLEREWSPEELSQLEQAKQPLSFKPPRGFRESEKLRKTMGILEVTSVLENGCEPSN